ncbi:MAG: PEP-CTERM sorting domain-containing protein [Gemmataceae bacterium]
MLKHPCLQPRAAGLAFLTLWLLTVAAGNAEAQIIWNSAGGGTWNASGSWTPATIPNAIGANATFNGAATGSNPDQNANRTVTLDAAQTVGSIVFNTDLSTFTNSLTTGTAGSLTFDQTGTGPATITTMGAGTGNNTISVPIILTDSLTGIVNNTAASSAAGSLNLTATITGAGGFTKQGDGLATFGTGTKTYTGPTVLSGGRMRISVTAQPSATSSFTINAGAQLDIITAGTIAVGSGPLNLNGVGATTGPYAAFPGAIRNDRGLAVTFSNPVVLQSNTLIHVQANVGTGSTSSPVGSTTFSNTISGPGRLTFTAPGSDIEQGFLILNGANTYTGGTLVAGGILQVSGAGATLGTGNVTVDNASSPASIARLQILAGVSNAINNLATLTLAGGGTAGVADQNYIDLGAGINDTVAQLVLGGVTQVAGTYGSTASTATFKNDEYFTGTGIITVTGVPEPGSLALVGFGFAGFAVRVTRRKRRRA